MQDYNTRLDDPENVESALQATWQMQQFMSLGSFLGKMDYSGSILPFGEFSKKMLNVTVDELVDALAAVRERESALSLSSKDQADLLDTLEDVKKGKQTLEDVLSPFRITDPDLVKDIRNIMSSDDYKDAYSEDKDEYNDIAIGMVGMIADKVAGSITVSKDALRQELKEHGYIVDKKDVHFELPERMNPDASIEVQLGLPEKE